MMVTGTAPDADWRSFMTEPAQYIHAERLAHCFGGVFPTGLCARMLAAPRLADRLSGLITTHYKLPPAAAEETFDTADRIVAVTPVGSLTEIVRRAGAIFWSAAIANTVLAREVSALQSAIGEALCSVAIKHRDLAGPEQSLDPFDTLAERISADGWRCFAAWCDAVDPAIGSRTRLKLPIEAGRNAPVPEQFTRIGPAIIRRATVR